MKLEDAAKGATRVQLWLRGFSPMHRWMWLGLFAIAAVAIGAWVVSSRPPLQGALVAAVLIHAFTWAFRLVWRAHEAAGCLPHWYPLARRVAMIAVPIAGAVVAACFWFGPRDDGVALYLVGIGMYIGFGIAVNRWRAWPDSPGRRSWGIRLLVGATALALVCLVVATVNVTWSPLVGVLIAMLVYPSGIALLAEGGVCDEPTGTLRLTRGLACVAAGLAGFSLAGVGFYQAVFLTVALLALVGLIASNTAQDIVLVIVAIVLFWSLDPQPGPAEPDPKRGQSVIVAMGDSYMSGEGSNSFFEGTNHNGTDRPQNECRRAPSAYPMEAASILAERGKEHGVLFVACSGAKARQLTTEAQYKGEPTSSWQKRCGPGSGSAAVERVAQAQLEQAVAAITACELKVEAVLISIGGNDAGFGEIGQACGLAGDCSVLGQEWLEGLEKTRLRLRATYAQVKSTPAFAGARIIVVPYPVAMNESGCKGSLLRANEHRFLVGFTRALDRVLEEEAEQAGFEFLARGVDVFTRARLRICDVAAGSAAVNQLAASPVAGVFLQQVSPRGWFHNTFHPNGRGHDCLAVEIADLLGPPPSDEDSRRCGPPLHVDESTAAMSLAGIMGAGFDHCSSPTRAPATCHVDRSAWMVSAFTRMLWSLVVPVLLVVLGALLVSMEGMRRWRGNVVAAMKLPQV